MAIARSKSVGISAWKLRRVMNLVRGMNVDEAETCLSHMESPAAKVILTIVLSAIANAENNDAQQRENLVLKRIFADQGPQQRRFRPKARGRAGSFNRPYSHITIEVISSDSEE